MKKALTILVIFAIVLSLSASAFADNGGIKITKNPSKLRKIPQTNTTSSVKPQHS